jgi:predicted PurR-regulated permease PerM
VAADSTHNGGIRRSQVFPRSVWTWALLVAIGLLIWQIMDAILLAFMAVLIATLLRRLADVAHQYTHAPVRWSLPIVGLLLVGLVALSIWLAGPGISAEADEFLEKVPTSLQGIYFAVHPSLYQRGITLLVSKNKSDRVQQALDASGRTLRYWLLGQAVLMLCVGILTTLGLWLAGVPMAFLLGVIAGLLEFIPLLGSVLGAVPGVLVALTQDPQTVLYAVLVYIVVQQLENQLLAPLVQKKAVHLPPALVILVVVAFGLLFGIPGILVATPMTAVIMVCIKMLYVQDVLGKSTDTQQ